MDWSRLKQNLLLSLCLRLFSVVCVLSPPWCGASQPQSVWRVGRRTASRPAGSVLQDAWGQLSLTGKDLFLSWLSSLQSGLALGNILVGRLSQLPSWGRTLPDTSCGVQMCLTVALLLLQKGFRFWETRGPYLALGFGTRLRESCSVSCCSKPRCPLPTLPLENLGQEANAQRARTSGCRPKLNSRHSDFRRLPGAGTCTPKASH